MPYRLFALDLDGTVIDGSGGVRPATRAAIAEARAAGFEVILVTGRHHAMARAYYRQFDLATPLICCNGTYVYDFARESIVAGEPLPTADARRVVDLAGELGLDLLLYTSTILYYGRLTPHIDKLNAWIAASPEPRADFRLADDFAAILAGEPPVWKFVVTHADAARLRHCHDELRRSGRFDVEYSWHDRVDVMPAGNSKAARLLQWAAAAGYAPAEIVAFGDNFNDLAMLGAVGHGIAMGNAPDEVKAGAREVIGDNDSDAIADTIRRFIAAGR